MGFNRRATGGGLALMLAIAAIGVGVIGWVLPVQTFQPSAIKNTGGCLISCFRALAFGSTYCSGLVSNGMVMKTNGGTLKLDFVINIQISNDTGTFLEIQADLIDNVTNNNYLALGKCGTFKGAGPQELGVALYLPFSSQFFGQSGVVDYPINTVQISQLIGATTYFASISIRPFAINGTNTASGSVNTRLSSFATNSIGLLETS